MLHRKDRAAVFVPVAIFLFIPSAVAWLFYFDSQLVNIRWSRMAPIASRDLDGLAAGGIK